MPIELEIRVSQNLAKLGGGTLVASRFGRSVMLCLFFHLVWPCFLWQIVWLSSPSLRNNGMIFLNVLFIVYGISCTRGQIYDLKDISGVYNHVHISRVITQPG